MGIIVDQQNDIRRQRKQRQTAIAQAKAVHTKKDSESEQFDYRFFASFDHGTLESASYLCKERGFSFVDSRGMREMISCGKMVLKIDDNQPLIGGKLITVTKDQFKFLNDEPIMTRIRSIIVMVVPPFAVSFIPIKSDTGVIIEVF